MAFQRPGVYVQETLNPVQSVVGPNSDSYGAFIGPNDRGPVSSPTLVTSWSQYVTLFGQWNTTASNDLPIAVYMFFANGGSACYVVRVTSGSPVAALRNLNDRAATPLATLRISAKNVGTWGNNLNISISDSTTTGLFDISIYDGGSTDSELVERFTDLSMVSTNARYAPNVINTSSNYVVALDLLSATTGTNKNPAVITNQSLSTGANGSAVTAVSTYTAFDTILQSLILHVPGFTDATTVNAAIAYAVARGDVFVVIDSGVQSSGMDLPIGDAATSNTQLNLTATYTASSQAAVYYPRLYIADPTVGAGAATGQTKLVGAGGAVVGLYASTDASRGVFKAPAGLQARLAGAVSVTKLTNAELDAANSAAAPVNAIKFVPGTGIVVMGARTLKAGYVDKYVPVRRTLIYLRKAATDLTEFALFEPNDPFLWRRVTSTLGSFLTNFWSQGGLYGASPAQAFYVRCDATINPQGLIDNGELHIEIGVALQRPAEFVIIKIGQFNGNTTVTVA
jgi:phage tail sheath protein FI